MRYKEMTKALAVAMRKDGYELDNGDRQLIRRTISEALAAHRRKEDRDRVLSSNYIWQRPKKLRKG